MRVDSYSCHLDHTQQFFLFMNRPGIKLVAAGIVTVIVRIFANILVGGRTPPVRGDVALLLGSVAVLAQLCMWVVSARYGATALWRKDYWQFVIALVVFVLLTVPLFLPLPSLAVK